MWNYAINAELVLIIIYCNFDDFKLASALIDLTGMLW